jgi:RimJ/RimL family protein N-acetyltransferase
MARLPAPREPIGDGTVLLRAWRDKDVEQMVEACADPEIPRWTAAPDPYTEADARDWVAGRPVADEPPGDRVSFAIADARDDTRLLGAISVMRMKRGATGEIGYWAAPWARGRGVMTRAVQLLARWAVDEFELRRVEMLIAVENAPSLRVAEKAGFTKEGVLRQVREAKGVWRDHAVFSVLPGEI